MQGKPDRQHGAASVEIKVTPGRGGVGDGRLKDDVPAPNNELVQFSRRGRSCFPAVSFKATPVKLKRSHSQVKADKRAVSGPAQTVAVAAVPCRMQGEGTVRGPEDGRRSVRQVSFMFGRFPLGCFEG